VERADAPSGILQAVGAPPASDRTGDSISPGSGRASAAPPPVWQPADRVGFFSLALGAL